MVYRIKIIDSSKLLDSVLSERLLDLLKQRRASAPQRPCVLLDGNCCVVRHILAGKFFGFTETRMRRQTTVSLSNRGRSI